MKHDVIMYGSETISSLLSNFLHLYENSNSNPGYPYKGIIHTSFIIASLKYNFSGYLINPMNFLKL